MCVWMCHNVDGLEVILVSFHYIKIFEMHNCSTIKCYNHGYGHTTGMLAYINSI